MIPSIDFETYSEAGFAWDAEANKWRGTDSGSKKTGLPLVGSRNYITHPSFEIICMAYDMRDGRGVRLWTPADEPPMVLLAHVVAGGLVQAWNVSFEWQCWEFFCHPKLGWPRLPLENMRCAMARSAANGYPRSLEAAGDVVLRPAALVPRYEMGKPLLISEEDEIPF